MKSRLWNDDRALTMGFIELIGSLGVGAAILWVVYTATSPMLSDARAAAPGGMGGMRMNDWFSVGNEVLPGVFLFCAFFGFIVRAVYERRAA